MAGRYNERSPIRIESVTRAKGAHSEGFILVQTGSSAMTAKKPASSAALTLAAARRLSRRTMLKNATIAGAALAVGPWLVKDAFSSSGELNVLNWSDELPDPVIPEFTKKTGIKVNTTPFSQNEEQINKLQATGGEGFDLY